MRPELAELRKPRLVLVIVLAVLVNAVTFGHFTFLAPVVTGVAGWFSLDVLGREPIVLLPLVFVLGVLSFAVGSTLIARVLHHAAGAPTMAGSYATAALNIGATAGPLLFAAQ
ncbi:hypothetical protein AB0M48_30350 [Lentzea sp. NPDC051208]|uniref:hypothetical protein n=1 Tax=Lentzea sp. NPDC051208 TaxID=3154642 RepID=UPI00343D525F